MYAAVFPLMRTRALGRPFDYRIPDHLCDRIATGSLVAAPLGGQTVLGVVLAVAATTAHRGRVVPLSAAVDLPAVPAELIDLAERVRDHYLCSSGSALTLVTPPTGILRLERSAALTEAGRAALAMGRDELAAYSAGGVLKAGRVPDEVRRLRAAGLVETTWRVHVVRAGRVERMLTRGPETPPRPGARQRHALEMLESAGACGETDLRRVTGLSSSGLDSLLRRDAVRIVEAAATPDSDHAAVGVPGAPPAASPPATAAATGAEPVPDLLPEQAAALQDVLDAGDGGGVVLLHGVTGSGKTEVYLRAAAEILARGRTVIVLVPEIALTGQTVARLRARFPGEVLAVLHSSLPAGERVRAYVAAAEGRARIVVGARSAVFAPVRNIGLIVVDEEHDDSYKQESDPRYDARTIARWRAAADGAALVFGSATPRVETWADVAVHARLTRRVDGSRPPALEIVDLRDSHDVLCAELRSALVACVESGSKAILFLNRRGIASYVSCAHCGHTWMCPSCDVAYALVRRATELRCRICGRRQAAPHVCPVCGGLDVGRHGVGTERLEAEVAAMLPGVALLRLDSDVAGSYRRLHALLDRFAKPGPGVLVGTQMVAKGHHFPEVTLVGVVNADLALYFPDFRAEERTFAMLLQVGGRAGRGRRSGRVIVQTYAPEARPIVAAAAADVEGFYADELERRRALSYPPASTLIALHTSSPAAEPVPAAGVAVAAAMRGALGHGEVVMGPGVVGRERGRYFCRCVIKTTEMGKTLPVVRHVVARLQRQLAGRGVRLMVDVEPVRL